MSDQGKEQKFIAALEKMTTQSTVDHPQHYNIGSIEVIDAIEAWKLNFSLGSAIKYIARADYKENAIEDLQKAAWYINREIWRRTQIGN